MAPSQQHDQPNGTSTSTSTKQPAFNTIPEAIEAFGTSSPPSIHPFPPSTTLHNPKLTSLLKLQPAATP